MNSSGKVDRSALPALGAEPATGGSPPRTLIEAMLVDGYAGVLGVDQLGADASFFDVGGSSLQAMQLVSRIERDLGIDVAVADIFLAPQPRELARLLRAEYGLRDADLDAATLAAFDQHDSPDTLAGAQPPRPAG
jgi:acyl carrier protein